MRKRVFSGAVFLLSGTALSQGIRLVGNLVLTRLLVPELFGLMALVNVLMMALGLFSDIGVGPGVIRSKRGLEPDFLNTAWTMQVVRGICLWMMTILVAYPAAYFYEKPVLAWILPVAGVGFFISGFNSMMIATLNKELKMGKLVAMGLGSQVLGLFIMMLLAYIYRNIWALVIGGMVGTLVKMIWSHRLVKEFHHHFTWDRSVAAELFHFGKWIFLATAMMFLATQADRLILGKLFPLALLGIYSIAAGFAELPKSIVNTMSSNIIFPVVSMYSGLDRKDLRTKILQKRKLLLVPMALLVALFFGFGDFLIKFLYDSRYQEAGWILPLLALGMWPLLLYASIDRVLYVVDNPRYPAFGNCFKFIYMIICLPLAYTFAGKLGAVLVVAFNDIPIYLAINYGLKKKGVSGVNQDVWATCILFVFVGVILLVRQVMGVGMPGISVYIP